MKIAVACEGNIVTQHFGHCEKFNIYETEGNKITKETSVPNPGHKPGVLPNYLNDLKVNLVISGGMGGGAIDIFNEKSIIVITGASGNPTDLVNSYLQGKLKASNSACREHNF